MMIRPTARFLLAHPAHFLALGFGTGLAPIAPGTVGTLLAFPIYQLLTEWLVPMELFMVIVALFALGIWACGKTGEHMGIADHSAMNWDEVVAFLLVLMLTPPGPGWQALAFFGFRFFDVIKPPPIRHFDRTMKGGFGVMFDDILAAFYTLLLLAVVRQMGFQ
jgi:phosphatidylglycerophosphatase A